MAFLDKCCCCSLAIAAGFLAVYLLITYLIAFAFELLWIWESQESSPSAAILLCAGYLTLGLFDGLLIHGVLTRNVMCLISWMFAVCILIFPEAGLVIYMSIQFWRIETLYGMTELACWLARILANVLALVVVHSLHSLWKEEDLVSKRLQDLSLTAVTIPGETSLNSLNSQYYQNNAFENSMEHLNLGLKRAASTPQLWNGNAPQANLLFPFDAYQYHTQSEFNASIFVPNVNNEIQQLDVPAQKKAQSLMDLRNIDENPLIPEKIWHPWVAQTITRTNSGAVYPNYAVSLDRKVNSKLHKFASLDDLNEANKNGHIIQNRTGFYAQPIANYGVPIYYGPLDGPDFLIYKKQVDKLSSKNSLSNTSTDDVQK